MSDLDDLARAAGNQPEPVSGELLPPGYYPPHPQHHYPAPGYYPPQYLQPQQVQVPDSIDPLQQLAASSASAPTHVNQAVNFHLHSARPRSSFGAGFGATFGVIAAIIVMIFFCLFMSLMGHAMR